MAVGRPRVILTLLFPRQHFSIGEDPRGLYWRECNIIVVYCGLEDHGSRREVEGGGFSRRGDDLLDLGIPAKAALVF